MSAGCRPGTSACENLKAVRKKQYAGNLILIFKRYSSRTLPFRSAEPDYISDAGNRLQVTDTVDRVQRSAISRRSFYEDLRLFAVDRRP